MSGPASLPGDRRFQRRETALVLLSAAALWVCMFLIQAMGFVHNADYSSMEYFVRVLLAGGDPYSAPPTDALYIFPHPGLQAVVMAGVYWLDDRLPFSLFHLVQYAHALAAIFGALWLARRGIVTHAHVLMLVLLTLLNPLMFYYLRVFPSDKYFMLSMPVVLSVLAAAHWRLGCFLAGLFAAMAGMPIFTVPLLVLDRLARPLRWRSLPLARPVLAGGGLALAGLAVGMAPLFPEALSGWAVRAQGEAGAPYWYSLWLLVGDLYFPGLNKIAGLLLLGGVYLLRLRGSLSTHQAILLACSLFLMLSANQVIGRLLPLVALLALYFRMPGMAAGYGCLSFAWSLLLTVLMHRLGWLHENGGTREHVVQRVLIFNFPLLLFMLMALAEGFLRRRDGDGAAPAAAAS